MNRAILLDRDGTINVDHGYMHDPAQLEFIEGAVKALRELSAAGYTLIIITNQSGIGRGYFSEEQYEKFNTALTSALAAKGVEIAATYMCPHAPSEPCTCRKPQPELAQRAIADFDIDTKRSYMLGDKPSDVECGEAAGLKSRLITKEKDLLFWSREIIEGRI